MFENASEDFNYLIELVDRASVAIMDVYKFENDVAFKNDRSPVTNADLAADAILCEGILSRWPKTFVLSEESTSHIIEDAVDSYWAIDPLDGTKEFIQKNGEFTVNIAWIEKGQPVLGLVALPAQDILYIGWAGHYAQKRVKESWQILPNIKSEPDWLNTQQDLSVAVSRSHPAPELDEWLKLYPYHKLRELGSSLKICAVAEGVVDCYPRLGRTCYWDIAAAHAVLRAVGGEIWEWPITKRIPLRYDAVGSPFNNFFIASGAYEN